MLSSSTDHKVDYFKAHRKPTEMSPGGWYLTTNIAKAETGNDCNNLIGFDLVITWMYDEHLAAVCELGP